MSLEKVFVEYVAHYMSILFKAAKAKRNMTHAEKLGVAYYKAAASRVQALINAPTPAWVGLEFKSKKSAFD